MVSACRCCACQGCPTRYLLPRAICRPSVKLKAFLECVRNKKYLSLQTAFDEQHTASIFAIRQDEQFVLVRATWYVDRIKLASRRFAIN